MELKTNIQNIGYGLALSKNGQENFVSPKNNNKDLSFCGAKEKIVADIAKMGQVKAAAVISPHLMETGGRIAQFIRRTVTKGYDVKYGEREEIFGALKKNFGSTFEECMETIDDFNKRKRGQTSFLSKVLKKIGISREAKDPFIYTKNPDDNTITFHRFPFFKNVVRGIKEFTIGTILDIAIAARKGLNKLFSSTSGKEASKGRSFINRVLDDRIAEKKARDAFYKLIGVFEGATEGLEKLSMKAPGNAENLAQNRLSLIGKNIKNLAKDSIINASKKVGKYNTKTERAWNRLATGAVSATFAATDFYNISMLQKNNPEDAKKAGHGRFMQDMRRQSLTAGITYVILGAFQNKVNKSMLYAVLSLGGVTLISEILSRVMGGIPLTPLSPESAKELVAKRNKKPFTKDNNVEKSKIQNSNNLYAGKFQIPAIYDIKTDEPVKNDKDVFNVFTKINNKVSNTNPAFTSNSQETGKNGKKKSSPVSWIPKIALGAVGFSLVIGLLRSKNVLHIDDAIKAASKKYNEVIKKLTQKRLILPEEQVDGLMDYLQKNGFEEQHGVLNKILSGIKKSNGANGCITGSAELVQRHLPKSKINPEGLYYDLGYVESKGKAAIVKILLYPLNTISRLFKSTNSVIRKIFTGQSPKAPAEKLSQKNAVTFISDYSAKLKKASAEGNMHGFKEELQDALTRHFSEANSKNKNTTLAMVSRFLITLISGYFFVNDYRNQVLIESNGEDVERANAVMKERIGHKVSNFFLNSMFMDIFNTTFEHTYLGSVPGAVGVAMATEYTNETAVRASICTPTKKMTREELIEYENKRLNDKGIKGKYYRAFMKLTGKKPLSEKAKKD